MSRLLALIVAYIVVLTITGYLRLRPARRIAWILAILSLVVSLIITHHQTPIIRMLVIVVFQLVSMKTVVYAEVSERGVTLNFLQWMVFAIGWFGMRPDLFKNFPKAPLSYRIFFIKGFSRIAAGLALLYLSALSSLQHLFFLPTLLLLAALSLILHFGILNLSVGVWRACGVPVPELFPSPYQSLSLKEFWGKRWNVAFSEMTALIVYRPLKSNIGSRAAVVMAFLFSGLLHETAISLPVRTGYGLPMLYFGIHALCMQLEEQPIVKRMINHPITGRLWVLGCLLLPLPLLFHPSFVLEVLEPIRTLLLKPVASLKFLADG